MINFFRILFLGLCFLLVGCNAADKDLMRADQLMETAPDSALHILQKIKSTKYNHSANRALYALLMSQALDKNDIKVESDSLIHIATNYYHENEPLRAAYAYFYLARCENNRGNSKEQALALLKAQEFSSKCTNYKLQGLIYDDKALMYQSQGQLDSMIVYNKLGLAAFQKANDLRNSVIAVINIGGGYLHQSKLSNAMSYFYIAEKLAKPLHEPLLTSAIYRSLGTTAYKQMNYALALHYFRLTPLTDIQYYNYNNWFLMGKTFFRLGELDSVKVYLNKVKNPYPMTAEYYQLWQELYEKQGRLPEALYFAKRVNDAKDSIQEHALSTSFAGMEKKYRYEHLSVENKNLIIQNKQNGIVILIALLIASFLFISFLYWRIKTNKRQFIVQKRLLDQEKILMKREKENNILLQQQMKMQHVLLKNVEQYRKQSIKRPTSAEDKLNESNAPKIISLHEELINHINVTHQNISIKLSEKHPILTQRDILICCLILANFDTGMIATILEVQPESINVHRGRLRKKLLLQNSEKLFGYLQSI